MAATVWKGYISFGLVSFPVRLFAAARAESVHFHMLHKKDLSRVKEVFYCTVEDKPIDRADIVKGYETSKDRYVVLDEADLKNMAPATASTMEIVQFVGEAEIDPIFFEHSYYVAPDEVAKPYALFLKALKESGQGAIAKVAMHGREHVVLIRAGQEGLVLHTLFYPNELHAANRPAIPASAAATKKEVELATQLIKQLSAPFKPEQFHDTYREQVEKLIEQKEKGGRITKQAEVHRAPVIDLMEALKKSLAVKGKSTSPASLATSVTKRSRRKKAA